MNRLNWLRQPRVITAWAFWSIGFFCLGVAPRTWVGWIWTFDPWFRTDPTRLVCWGVPVRGRILGSLGSNFKVAVTPFAFAWRQESRAGFTEASLSAGHESSHLTLGGPPA